MSYLLKMQAFGLTHQGLSRKENQDSILVAPELGIVAVADGMGGHSYGELASQMAVELLHQEFQSSSSPLEPDVRLINLYEHTNLMIYKKSLEIASSGTENKGMGTTLVSLNFHETSAYICNVGDSRAYLYRDGGLWPMTEDHSVVNEQRRAGVEFPEIKNKSMITRSVGFESQIKSDVFFRRVLKDDVFILCSDGLHGFTTEQKMLNVLNETEFSEVPQKMIDIALEGGGGDNVSCIICRATENQ